VGCLAKVGGSIERLTLLEVLLSGGNQLQGNELEATVLKALDDPANEPALDAIGLQSGTISRASSIQAL